MDRKQGGVMDRQREGSVGRGAGGEEATSALGPRRLFDRPGITWSPSEARAVGFLRTVTPYQETQGRKERVRIALTEASVRSGRMLLRPMAVIGIVVGGGAVSSAAVWHWPARVVGAYERLIPGLAAPVSRADHEHLASRRRVASVDRTPQTEKNREIAETHAAVAPVGKSFVGVRTIESERIVRHEFAAHARARHPAPIREGEDTTPVLAAMRALRRAHDPVRARALLDTYLGQHPEGALAEEALALSIEAAVAHGDSDAGSLADRYLRLYPAGPFRSLARQTLASLSARPPG